MARGIRALLDTVAQALPQVGNLGLLFFLLFFIFAALGVELFGRLGKFQGHKINFWSHYKFKSYFIFYFATITHLSNNSSCILLSIHILPIECSEEHPCEGLSSHAHFMNFGMGFLTLFRVATGDNWNGIMKVIYSFG